MTGERFPILKKAYGVAKDTVKKVVEPATEYEQGMVNASDEMRPKSMQDIINRARGVVYIPQTPGLNIRPELKPYDTQYIGRGAGDAKDLMAGSEALTRLEAAEQRNRMQQLENLEQVGEFEEPDSEVNIKAAKLRALLGR